MQRVTELVEQSLSIGPGNEHGLSRRSFDEVRVVRTEHRFLAVERLVAAIGGRPGTGAFSRSGIGVEIPDTDMLAGRLVGNFPNAHVLVKNRDGVFRNRGEFEMEQLAGDEEHGLAKFVQLQILFHFVGIKVVLRLAHFFRVVTIVPRGDGDARTVGVGDRLHIRDFFLHPRRCSGPHRFHQLERALGRLCHPILESPQSVVFIP